MRVYISLVHFAPTSPTPVLLASRAGHMCAPFRFLCLCFAAGTGPNISSQPRPNPETTRPLVVTPTLVPRFPTPETHGSSAGTHRFIFATTGLSDYVLTIGTRAPLDGRILSNLDISLDMLVKLCVFLFAEISYLLIREDLVTVLLHTSDLEYFARLNARGEILLDTGNAGLVTARECK